MSQDRNAFHELVDNMTLQFCSEIKALGLSLEECIGVLQGKESKKMSEKELTPVELAATQLASSLDDMNISERITYLIQILSFLNEEEFIRIAAYLAIIPQELKVSGVDDYNRFNHQSL